MNDTLAVLYNDALFRTDIWIMICSHLHILIDNVSHMYNTPLAVCMPHVL
jgi:hypothetical protein